MTCISSKSTLAMLVLAWLSLTYKTKVIQVLYEVASNSKRQLLLLFNGVKIEIILNSFNACIIKDECCL